MAVRIPDDVPADASYPIEVVHDGWRVCASTPDEALGLIAEGYADLTEEPARRQARLVLALRARVMVQTLLNAGELFEQTTEEEQQVLLHRQDSPPAVDVWASVIPLTLVTSYYRPLGERDQPGVAGPGQIWWIDPHTARSLLETLHQVRWLDVVRMDPAAAEPGSSYRNLGPNGASDYWWRHVVAEAKDSPWRSIAGR